MISILTGVLSKLPGAIGDYFKSKNEIAQLEVKKEIVRVEKEIDLQGEYVKADLARGLQQLKSTPTWIRTYAFIQIATPINVAIYDAFMGTSYSQVLFGALKGLPEWYIQTYMIVMMAVWGLSAGKDAISNIFRGLGQFMLNRQTNKLKIKENNGNTP